jgi:hypothetical protein
MSREPLPNKLIEDRYVEITTDLRKGEVKIIHNYTNNEMLIKTLENAIKKIKEQ